MPAKSTIDPNLAAVILQLAELAGSNAEARKTNQKTAWLRPSGQVGYVDPKTDVGTVQVAKIFDIENIDVDLIKAAESGQPVDLTILTIQRDYLQQMERAYRARNTTFQQGIARTCAVEGGHSETGGGLQIIIKYIQALGEEK
jgi:hypothetical protein